MADFATLTARPAARLGHFLPYLLRRRLLAVVWPAGSGARTAFLFILALVLLYGVGFGLLLNLPADDSGPGRVLPKYILGLHATVLGSALLVDFLPALRRVARPLPECFPVSARMCAVAAFLLDLITLRRLTLAAGLLTALAVAPGHAVVPGLALLLLLAAAMFSFNVRFLVALGRWRHPLLLAHLLSLGLLVGWVGLPNLAHHAAWGGLVVLLPWVLGAGQLYWLGPYFSARFLPDATVARAVPAAEILSRLPLEHRAYLRKLWGMLLLGLVLKVVLLGMARWQLTTGLSAARLSTFYLGLAAISGFTYVNNNLFSFVKALTANELVRLGLTPRVLWLYLRLVVPVVVADGIISAVLLLALFPGSVWVYLWLVPLYAVTLTCVGLWGSLYHAKPVSKAVNFANTNKNNSALMALATVVTAATLYFLPWWWARIVLAALVTASAIWPIRAVLRNDGRLRRRLWRGIGA